MVLEMETSTANLSYALKYHEAGCSVIPVGLNKKPFSSWSTNQETKHTEDEIRALWDSHPNANPAIVTGEISGIVVVDVDDMENGLANLAEYIPPSIETPTARTPTGGLHFYFKHPGEKIGNNRGGIPGCDFQGDGGYVVAPPSYCEYVKKGKQIKGFYEWIKSPDECDCAPLPSAYFKKIFLYNREQVSHITSSHIDNIQSQYFIEGRRDEDLFHAANCLIKAGANPQYVKQVIEILASNCNPPFPEKEIQAKIKSALDRAERRDRNIAEEVKQWILVTSGHFLVTDSHKELDLVTSSHKHAANVAFKRLSEGPNPLIERYGQKRGSYRLIESDVEIIDFLNAPVNEFDIDLPLLLSGQLKLYPGNVGIFAGAKSSGKTAIALDLIKRNQERYEVVYMNSEMHDTEMRTRLELHGDMKLTDWRFKAIRRGHDWADLITPEKKLFVIDYMENVDGDAWRIGSEIKKIHDKLKEGVAIIFLQKKSGEDLARGGQYTLDKARFYVALDKGKAKIIDAKAFRGENPNGKTLSFKTVQGTKIMPQGTWG